MSGQALEPVSGYGEHIPEPPGGAFAAFTSPPFRCLWFAFSFAGVGTWLQGVALDYATVHFGGRSLDLGLMNALKATTFVTVALVGGPVLDRYRVRRILVFTHLLIVAGSLLLGLVALRSQFSLLVIGVYTVYNAMILGIDHPARQTLIPRLVPRGNLANAVAWNALTYVGAGALGPALAFTVVHALGLSGPFFLRAFLFVAAAGVLVVIRLSPQHKGIRKDTRPAPTLIDFVGGVRYVFSTPGIRAPFLVLIVTGVLVAPFQAVLPMMAKTQYLHARLSPLGGVGHMPREILVLGWLHTAFGMGAVLGALLLVFASKRHLSTSLAWTAGVLYSVAIFLFAQQRQLPFGLALLLCAGACSLFLQALVEATLQRRCDPSMLGRVMSVYSICVAGAWSLASPFLTQLSDMVGPTIALSASSLAAVFLLLVSCHRFTPGHRRFVNDRHLDTLH